MTRPAAYAAQRTQSIIQANSNLTTAASGPARLAEEAARVKVDKYELAADAMRAVHLPFAVETKGGLSESAQQLIRETHHSAGNHNTWRDAAIIGTYLERSMPPANKMNRATHAMNRASKQHTTLTTHQHQRQSRHGHVNTYATPSTSLTPPPLPAPSPSPSPHSPSALEMTLKSRAHIRLSAVR